MTKQELIEMQQALILRVKNGECELLPELWVAIKPLVDSYARRYMRFNNGTRFFDEADLTQEGYFALLKAIEYWDPDKGLAFSTMFFWWFSYATREIRGMNGKDGIFSADSLDRKLFADDEAELSGFVEDKASAEDIEKLDDDIFRKQIRGLLQEIIDNQLTDIQRQVIQLRYYEGLTLAQVAEKLGVGIAKCRGIENDALAVFRLPSNIAKLRRDGTAKEELHEHPMLAPCFDINADSVDWLCSLFDEDPICDIDDTTE